MNWTRVYVSTRKKVLSAALLCLIAIGLTIGAQFVTTNATAAGAPANSSLVSPAATFPGTNTGAIPDGNSGVPPQYGSPRTINFAVSGLTANVANVSVDMTLTHTYVGDVEMVLAAPGGSPSIHLASRIGVMTAGSFGDNSNYNGTYSFSDAAIGTNIWTVATAAGCGDDCDVTAGAYRTVGPGQPAQTNPPPVTSLNTTFGGLTPASANGTWTLTFRDAGNVDTGTVTAANLTINTGGPVADGPFDYNGDGKTDFVVARNIGGGSSGQIRWFYNLNGTATTVAKDWGLASDWFLSGNIDEDNSDDIIVWRPGAPGTAAFYALKSTNNTVVIEPFGQDGDDPSVLQDYNNDGKTDWAVYRPGVGAGQQSVWYWRSSTTPGGPVAYVPWGLAGDFPAPGDYDGDGSADFVVQRNSGQGQAWFWRRMTTAPTDILPFGLPSDTIVPGDWDGDGKDDIATARNGAGGTIEWYYDPSSVPGVQFSTIWFGIFATDYFAHGDYDGDGRTDAAIWRNGVFWIRSTATGGVSTVQFGAAGDYPVADSGAH